MVHEEPSIGDYVQIEVRHDFSDDVRISEGVVVRCDDVVILSPDEGLGMDWTAWAFRIRKPRGLTILEALLQPVEECDKVQGDMEVV